MNIPHIQYLPNLIPEVGEAVIVEQNDIGMFDLVEYPFVQDVTVHGTPNDKDQFIAIVVEKNENAVLVSTKIPFSKSIGKWNEFISVQQKLGLLWSLCAYDHDMFIRHTPLIFTDPKDECVSGYNSYDSRIVSRFLIINNERDSCAKNSPVHCAIFNIKPIDKKQHDELIDDILNSVSSIIASNSAILQFNIRRQSSDVTDAIGDGWVLEVKSVYDRKIVSMVMFQALCSLNEIVCDSDMMFFTPTVIGRPLGKTQPHS
jgi:hypothetical protein